MKCPDCGCEIPEGKLLCENCGHEINIVPEFEIEVESSITNTLSSIVNDIVLPEEEKVPEDAADKDIKKDDTDVSPKLDDDFFEEISVLKIKEHNPKVLLTVLMIVAGLCLLIVTVCVLIYRRYSLDYQLDMAYKCIEKGRYEKALEYISNAKELKSDDTEIVLSEGLVYAALGYDDKAESILLGTIEDRALSDDLRFEFYDRLIEIYEEKEAYDKINDLLISSEDESIRSRYNDKMALPPEYSIPTGNYKDEMELEISANTSGRIIYTLDGSTPGPENGTLYTNPIILKSGEYDFSAVFFNDNGEVSDVGRSFYLIDPMMPDDPIIIPDSGNLSSPTKLKAADVDEGVRIFYTLDGTTPTEENGILYEGPIDIPDGNSNFIFVAISETGVSSNEVVRSYSLTIANSVSVDAASKNIIKALLQSKIITDETGKAFGKDGRYVFKYNSLIEIPQRGYYYRFDEYLTDGPGGGTLTGLLYAVDIYSGTPYRLLIEADNSWTIIPIG